MSYVVWILIGLGVALLFGLGARPLVARSGAGLFAGAFGALIGGAIGDGVPQVLAGELTVGSVIGSLIGAVAFCWAMRPCAT